MMFDTSFTIFGSIDPDDCQLIFIFLDEGMNGGLLSIFWPLQGLFIPEI